jgi:hypothetical protein
MMLPVLVLAAACIPVEGERIQMADLARAVPAFAAAPADAEVALAPFPGARRVLLTREIERLAEMYHIELPADARACFQRAVEPLTEARVKEALAKAAAGQIQSFTVLDFSHYPVPRGELEFGPPPRSRTTVPVVWRGHLRYGRNRSVPVWARVRIARPLREVETGDTVLVEVHSGGALLKFETRAESGGKTGETVVVRNPANGARFSARVLAKGEVTVDATETTHSAARGSSRVPGS